MVLAESSHVQHACISGESSVSKANPDRLVMAKKQLSQISLPLQLQKFGRHNKIHTFLNGNKCDDKFSDTAANSLDPVKEDAMSSHLLKINWGQIVKQNTDSNKKIMLSWEQLLSDRRRKNANREKKMSGKSEIKSKTDKKIDTLIAIKNDFASNINDFTSNVNDFTSSAKVKIINGNRNIIEAQREKNSHMVKTIAKDFTSDGDQKILRALGRTATVNAAVMLTAATGGAAGAVGFLTGGAITAKRLGDGVKEKDDKEVAKSLAVYGSATTASIVGQAVTGAVMIGLLGASLPLAGAVAFGVGCCSGITAGAVSEWTVDSVMDKHNSKDAKGYGQVCKNKSNDDDGNTQEGIGKETLSLEDINSQ